MAPKFCSRVSIDKMAEAADMRVKDTIDGKLRIEDSLNGSLIGLANTTDDAKNVIRNFIGKNKRNLDEAIPDQPFGTPLSGNPMRPQEQLRSAWDKGQESVRELISRFQYGPGTSFFTPAKQFAQALERSGVGKPLQQVYETTQKAKGRFNEAISHTIRPRLQKALGDKSKTFSDAIHELEARSVKLSPEQRKLVTLFPEAFSKEEIARPGGLLDAGMDQANITAADYLDDLGLAAKLPDMVRWNAVMDDFLVRRKRMVDIELPKMEQAVKDGKLPPEFQELISGLHGVSGESKNVAELMRELGFTDDFRAGMNFLRSLVDDKAFNIPAIYRYANAPKLGKFKTGRDQFVSQRGMTAEARGIAEDRWKILNEAFDGDDVLLDRVLGHHLPVFRQFISAGIMPGKQFTEYSSAAMRKWTSVVNDFAEGSDVLTRRVLSGHLDPYEFHPTVTAFKHVRNMLLKKPLGTAFDGTPNPSFDKSISDAVIAAERIKARDERSGQVLIDYLHELEGLPTESFKNLTAMIRTVARFSGRKVDDRVGERFINVMNKLAYNASIPFRPALIARNFYQMSLAIPIVGPKAFWHGIETAFGWTGSGFDQALVEAAKNRAIKANALRVNVIPLHAATEALGVGSEPLGILKERYAKMGFDIQKAFDKGFDLYRAPDDVGRVVAFEAGRHRVANALAKYERTGKDISAFERLKAEAKVLTFDETVEAEFESLIRQDRGQDAANYIGAQLADKIHFLYGDANHPSKWGGVGGKLLGQFGTFPVQYVNHVLESLTRGTPKDVGEFLFGHTAVNLGVVYAGSEIFDLDLSSWMFLPSMRYTGGPYAELFLSSIAAIGGSPAERSMAKRNINMMMPSLSFAHPSIFVPGSYAVADWANAFKEDNFMQGLVRGTGFRFLGDEQNAAEKFFSGIPGAVENGFGYLLD